MKDPRDEAVARIAREHPAWQVWLVPTVVGPDIWCARRWADQDAVPARVINTGSADELAQAIAATETEAGRETD